MQRAVTNSDKKIFKGRMMVRDVWKTSSSSRLVVKNMVAQKSINTGIFCASRKLRSFWISNKGEWSPHTQAMALHCLSHFPAERTTCFKSWSQPVVDRLSVNLRICGGDHWAWETLGWNLNYTFWSAAGLQPPHVKWGILEKRSIEHLSKKPKFFCSLRGGVKGYEIMWQHHVSGPR